MVYNVQLCLHVFYASSKPLFWQVRKLSYVINRVLSIAWFSVVYFTDRLGYWDQFLCTRARACRPPELFAL